MSFLIVAIIIIAVIYFFQKSTSSKSFSSPSNFQFSVKNLNENELSNLNEGNSVNFWQKPKTKTVFIYRAGTLGGQGRIGIVPDKYSKQIINDLQNDRLYDGKIVTVSPSDVKIKYSGLSKRKVRKRKKKYAKNRSEKLAQLLNKDYNPQKGFETSISLEKDRKVTEGESLRIRFREKDFYIKNPQSLKIEFFNSKNEQVGYKRNDPDKIRRILRAHFNDYEISTEISAITELDDLSLKYRENVPGTVRIDFEKNA